MSDMNKISEKLTHEEEIAKTSLPKRLSILLYNYLKITLNDILQAPSYLIEKDKRKPLFENIWKFIVLFYKKMAQESVLKEAAALTYITLLGFIPFLILIVFFVPKLPFLATSSKFQSQLYQNFMPSSTGDVGILITQLITQKVSFNIVSFIVVIVTSYSLFKVIRDTFDRILRMEIPPPNDVISQLLKFFGSIIFGFLIILLLFSSSSLPIISSLLDIPLFKRQLVYLFPFILQFVGLLFLYMILPSIKVKRSSLYRAAFWTTLIWVILKGLFDYYVYNLTNIGAVYGVVKSLPAFLFWIYINWVIVLAGIVLVSILEHKDLALEAKKNKHFVRLTVEMYTNKKLDKDFDTIINMEKLPKLIEKLTEDDKE
jgi:membrane protein